MSRTIAGVPSKKAIAVDLLRSSAVYRLFFEVYARKANDMPISALAAPVTSIRRHKRNVREAAPNTQVEQDLSASTAANLARRGSVNSTKARNGWAMLLGFCQAQHQSSSRTLAGSTLIPENPPGPLATHALGMHVTAPRPTHRVSETAPKTSSWHFDFRHEFVRLGKRNFRSTHARRASVPANERILGRYLPPRRWVGTPVS
jgi:hypothetical protein